MADENFVLRLEFDASQPQQAMEAISRIADKAATALEGAGIASDQYVRALKDMAKAAAGATTGVQGQVTSAKGWSQSMSQVWAKQFTEQEKAAAGAEKKAAREIAAADKAVAAAEKAVAREVAANEKQLRSEQVAADKSISFLNKLEQAELKLQTAKKKKANVAAASDWDAEFRGIERGIAQQEAADNRAIASNNKLIASERALNNARKARNNKAAAAEWDAEFKAADQAAKANQSFAQGLSTTRYALYDVSATLGIAGAAMVGLGAATFAVGIAWEKNFAAVVRTSKAYEDLSGGAVRQLRDEFMELGQTLPVTTRELAEIGALGGQLGISAGGIDEFTETVAKLTATTDLSAEAAGTALGRFNALFKDINPGNFENLASSILKVGTNSVATETQIVNIGTQISSMGAFAGMTAEQVVGLSGALASVGAQPELSRGTITRVFTLMSRAVSQGGEKLDEFARISGVSADQFRNAWGNEQFSSVFQGFLKGIGREGDAAVQSLNGLGVSSVRDVPLLLRLASAGKVVSDSFKDSSSGFKENTELANQYGVIAETTAARLQILANNFEIFLAAIADGGSAFGGLIDGLSNMLMVMTDIAQHPVGGTIAQIIVVATILSGVLLLIAAGGARAFASMIAMRQAMVGLGIQFPITGGAAAVFSGTLQAVGVSADKAAVSTRLLGLAMKTLAVAGVVTGVVAIGGALTDMFEQMSGRDTSFEGLSKGLGSVSTAMKTMSQGTSGQSTKELVKINAEIDKFVERGTGWAAPLNQGLGQFFNDLNIYSTQSEKDFARIDRAMAETAASGDLDTLGSQLSTLGKETGLSLNQMIDTFPRFRAAIEESGIKVKETADGMYTFKDAAGKVVEGVNAIADAEAEATAKAELFAATIGFETADSLKTFQDNIASSSAGFFNYGDMIQRVQDKTRGWAEEQSKAAYDSKDSWQEFYDGSSVNINDFMAVLDEQIAQQTTWADDMKFLTEQGATAFVSELAKMGPEGAPLAAAAVNMAEDELLKLEDKARMAAFLSSAAFAEGFTDQIPVLQEAYNHGGIEAVEAMIVALRTGSAEVEQVAKDYGYRLKNNPLKIIVTSSGLYETQMAIQNLLRTSTGNRSLHIATTHQGGLTMATGGYVRGPGTGTSDSIPARLSNGEYVIKAAAVRALGTGYLNAINQGRRPQHFATGGQVGRSQSGSAPIGVGIMELGPKTLGRMGGSPVVNVYLDDRAIALAANRGNEDLRGQGH